jgi:hypothetical protein
MGLAAHAVEPDPAYDVCVSVRWDELECDPRASEWHRNERHLFAVLPRDRKLRQGDRESQGQRAI